MNLKIRKANYREFDASLRIARSLGYWFSKEAVEHMSIDFKMNHLLVAIKDKELSGFMCYSSEDGALKIDWLGVRKKYRRNGVGKSLVGWLEEEANKVGAKYIRVETLSDIEKNKHYEETRQFYYNLRFKKIYDFKPVRKSWNNTILLEKKVAQ